jgi:GMP synthase-like glutamine amidotransferase
VAADGFMRPGLILQHAVTGPPGRLGSWADDRGIDYRVHLSSESAPDFDPAQFGFIASLGSAHSVNDRELEWIATEVELLRRAVAADVPVLGLCWGGQALASALGAPVQAAPLHEKGWLAVTSEDAAIPDGPWLHYHTEIFGVPRGAVALARSPAGPAAFRTGKHLGLQFHPEADLPMAIGWAAKDPDQTDASRARFTAEGERWDRPAGTLAYALFDAWWSTL